ncbi:MAG: STAS domain-containing protein [Acidobacteriota bacterium]
MEQTRGKAESAADSPLELSGGAGIESVSAMRGQLLQRLADAEPVLVADCSRVERAGTSLLQLFLAAEAALALRGKTLRLTGLTAEFRRDLQDAGMRGWFLELPTGGGGA